MTELWKQGQQPLIGFRILRIGLDPERQALYERINDRAQRMFDAGLVEETEDLLKQVWGGSSAAGLPGLPAGGAVGQGRD